MNSTSIEWLFNNASVLLWADKILVTNKDFERLHKLPYFDDESDQECARILFDRLKTEGIVETFDPSGYLNRTTLASIEAQVQLDEKVWGVDTGGSNENGLYDHNTIELAGRRYCQPLVRGIYGSLTMARFLDCSCVFDNWERSFLSDRFSAIHEFKEYQSAGQSVFNDLYQIFLPSLIPERDFQIFCDPERGSVCTNAAACSREAKGNLRKMIDYILVAREKPEVRSLASRLEELEASLGPDESEIRRALLKDVRNEQRKVRMAYPRVRHWSRLTQMASAPALLYGTQTGQSLIWMTAAGIAALAEALHVSIEQLQERRRWLTLIAEEIESSLVGVNDVKT